MSAEQANSQRSGTFKRNWALFICGIAIFLIGLALLLWPDLTLQTIALVAGILLIIEGAASIVIFAVYRARMDGAAWLLINGILSIIVGLMFVIHPIIAAEVIPWVSGLFVTLFGIYSIVAGIFMSGSGALRALLIIGGILTLVFGILFIVVPAFFDIVLALFLIVRGITMAVFGVTPTRGFIDTAN